MASCVCESYFYCHFPKAREMLKDAADTSPAHHGPGGVIAGMVVLLYIWIFGSMCCGACCARRRRRFDEARLGALERDVATLECRLSSTLAMIQRRMAADAPTGHILSSHLNAAALRQRGAPRLSSSSSSRLSDSD